MCGNACIVSFISKLANLKACQLSVVLQSEATGLSKRRSTSVTIGAVCDSVPTLSLACATLQCTILNAQRHRITIVAGFKLAAHFPKDRKMNIHLSLAPIIALLAGILILAQPKLLNYIVAIYLIVIGLLGLFGGSLNLR